MPFCNQCGTKLADSAKFCPSCGTAFQGSPPTGQQNFQTAATINIAPTPPVPPSQPQPANPVQQNVVIMGKQKSVGVAFLLSFLLGPLGLLYASVIGGIVMFFVSLLLFFLLPIVGIFLCWIACIIWAVYAADQANKSMMNSGNALINNQFRQ